MSRLKREGNPPSGQWASPVPQAWDPSINDFRELTGQNLGGGRFGADGVQWGKTASGLFVPVRVTNDGVQEVQLSGNIVTEYNAGRISIAAGAKVRVYQNLDNKFRKMSVLVYAENAGWLNNFKIYERFTIGSHGSGSLERLLTTTYAAGRLYTEIPFEVLSPNNIQIYLENKDTEPRDVYCFFNLWQR